MLFEFPQIDFNCNDIHSGLIDEGEVVCFMCSNKLIDIYPTQENIKKCQECDSTTLIEVNGIIVCSECGNVDDYLMVLDVNLYGNCRIRKRSIYQSRYYIQHLLNQISKKHRIQVPVRIRLLICKVIDLIRSSEEIMQGRKRIISINYIIQQIFKRAGIAYDFIPQSKWKITRKKYNVFWHNVMKSSIGCEIRQSVNK